MYTVIKLYIKRNNKTYYRVLHDKRLKSFVTCYIRLFLENSYKSFYYIYVHEKTCLGAEKLLLTFFYRSLYQATCWTVIDLHYLPLTATWTTTCPDRASPHRVPWPTSPSRVQVTWKTVRSPWVRPAENFKKTVMEHFPWPRRRTVSSAYIRFVTGRKVLLTFPVYLWLRCTYLEILLSFSTNAQVVYY